MDDKRMGEIALKLVEHRLMTSPMSAPANFSRELGNLAKDTEIKAEELRQFYEAMLPKMIGKMLNRSSVSLTTSNS